MQIITLPGEGEMEAGAGEGEVRVRIMGMQRMEAIEIATGTRITGRGWEGVLPMLMAKVH